MAYVKIIDTGAGLPGDEYRIYCDSVKVSGTKNVSSKPNANTDGPVEVQTLSFENVSINISGVHWTDSSDSLNYTRLMNLYKTNYNGANPSLLYIYIGDNNITPFPDMDGATSGIKVILKSFSVDMSSKDSAKAYMPMMALNFVETD